MEHAEFWRLIEDASFKSGGECEEQAAALKSSLLLLPADEIAAFARLFREHRQAAYRWDLWGAAYLVNGGGSDDGFDYFRCWLIAQGQAFYESALADPDSLADLLPDDTEWGDANLDREDIAYAAGEAYGEKTGQKIPVNALDFIPGAPVGVKWDEDDLDALYPKIAAKVGDGKTMC